MLRAFQFLPPKVSRDSPQRIAIYFRQPRSHVAIVPKWLAYASRLPLLAPLYSVARLFRHSRH
jgi:hypothetical protein